MPAFRAQTAIEYVFLVAGALMFVTFIVLVLRAGVISETADKLSKDVGNFLGFYAKDYIFFDNFDAGASRWTPIPGDAWAASGDQYHSTGAGISTIGLTVSNFSYNVWLKSAGKTGVIFRAQNETTYYAYTVTGNFYSLSYVHPGSGPPTSLAGGSFSSGVGNPAIGIQLRVDAVGNNVSFYGDGIHQSDYLFPGDYFDKGLFGLTSNGPADFDNVMVCKDPC